MSEMNDLPLSTWKPSGISTPLWARWIVDYNPCFLLSAVCMLLGCRLLNDAVNARTGDVRGALSLIATINLYEFCLLGVAYLIRRSIGMRRDVGLLLVTLAIFMCDITFVTGDLSVARPGLGAAVAIGLTVLAVIKAGLALKLLNAPKIGRVLCIIGVQILLILLLPVVYKGISNQHAGYLPPKAIYAGWWLAGVLPIAYRLVLGYRSMQPLPGLARVLVVAPYLAMLGHLLACTWVFKLPFYTACYAPVLLGLAVVVGISRYTFGRVLAANIEWGLATSAVLCAIGSPVDLALTPTQHHWAAISALRLTLFGAAMVNLHGWVALRHPLFGLTLGLMLVGALLGPTVRLMVANGRELIRFVFNTLTRLIPRTAGQWGLAAVGSSFVLLGLGAAFSLLNHRRKEPV